MRCSAAGCRAEATYANRTVLELGAGAGGLVTVALVRAGARVLATDGDPGVLDFLEANVRSNVVGAVGARAGTWRLTSKTSKRTRPVERRGRGKHHFEVALAQRLDTAQAGAFLGAERLCWADEDAVAAVAARLPELDLVVAADVVFRTIDTEALVATLEALAKRGAEVVVAHTRRFEREDEAFFALLAERFDVAPVPPDELHPTFGRGGDAGLTGVLRLRARAEREAGVT